MMGLCPLSRVILCVGLSLFYSVLSCTPHPNSAGSVERETTAQVLMPEDTTDTSDDNLLQDPETGVIIVNVTHLFQGYACPPYFSYPDANVNYPVVTSCTANHQVASESCADLGGTLGVLRHTGVAAAVQYAAYVEQGVKVHSKPSTRPRRKVAEYKFWTGPAIPLPWDSLVGSADDSMGVLKVTLYEADPAMYEWTTSVYGDDTKNYFWVCEVNSSAVPVFNASTPTAGTTTTSTATSSAAVTLKSSPSPSKSASSSSLSTSPSSLSSSWSSSSAPAPAPPREEQKTEALPYRRRKSETVMDYRPSAICIGSMAVIILVTIITIIVAMDFDRIYRALKTPDASKMKAFKKKNTSARSDIRKSPSDITNTSQVTISDIETTSLEVVATSETDGEAFK